MADRAIERTTPCLLGLFSLIVVLAKLLHPHALPLQTSAWYAKPGATFADALAAVRAHLWQHAQFGTSLPPEQRCLIPRPFLERLISVACGA